MRLRGFLLRAVPPTTEYRSRKNPVASSKSCDGVLFGVGRRLVSLSSDRANRVRRDGAANIDARANALPATGSSGAHTPRPGASNDVHANGGARASHGDRPNPDRPYRDHPNPDRRPGPGSHRSVARRQDGREGQPQPGLRRKTKCRPKGRLLGENWRSSWLTSSFLMKRE